MNVTRRTGIVRDPRYADHVTGSVHPECPDRLEVLDAMLQEPDMRGYFQEIAPRSAGKEELLRIHSPKYIRRLEDTQGKAYTYLDPDTQTSPFSHQAALLAAGGLCRAIDLVHAGELDNAFALVRPPGHHAEKSKSGGFCLYNNAAVGVRHAQNHLGLGRILVADWDLHHGNGTQSCFEDDPSVLYFSVHQYPSYPGSGKFSDAGKGRGKGLSVNIPILAGGGDGEYVALFEKILRPIALEFEPELILVSAGFDIHLNDPLGGMKVTPRGFAGLTRSVLNTADRCCGGKVVMTLEGGYNLQGLRDSVKAVLRELAGLQQTDLAVILTEADSRTMDYLIWRVRRVHGKHWNMMMRSLEDGSNPAPSIAERLRQTTARILAYLKS